MIGATRKRRGNGRTPLRLRLGGRAAACLIIAAATERSAAQGAASAFTPGSRDLFVLDLKTLGNNGLPNGVTVPGKAKPTVVMKDGVPMLKATERTDLIIHLPENLPDVFTLQFEITPKFSGAPEDFSFEGTFEQNRGEASMHVQWQVPTLIVVGGGDIFQMPIPDEIGLPLPMNLATVDVSIDHGTFALFTSGRLLTDPPLTNRKFVRGKILRVTLGGGCSETEENCKTPEDIEKYSVHLSKLRIAAGGGVVANQNSTQSTGGTQNPAKTAPVTMTAVVADPAPTTGNITPMTTPTSASSTPSSATKSTMADRSAPLSVPTGPAPANLRFAGIPNTVQLEWDAVPGAVRYELSYSAVGSTTWTPVTVTPTAGTPFWVGSPSDPTKTYTYRLIAYQADGRMGETKADFKTPTVEPKNFTATASGAREVRFEWDNVQLQYDPSFRLSPTINDPVTYLLAGPGTGTGFKLSGLSATTSERNRFTLKDAPPGTQTWTLTVMWNPGGVLTPQTSWPTATVFVPEAVLAPRSLLLDGFVGAGGLNVVVPRTVTLPGFVATGGVTGPPVITLPGFASVGGVLSIPPRTIELPGWIARGTSSPSP